MSCVNYYAAYIKKERLIQILRSSIPDDFENFTFNDCNYISQTIDHIK